MSVKFCDTSEYFEPAENMSTWIIPPQYVGIAVCAINCFFLMTVILCLRGNVAIRHKLFSFLLHFWKEVIFETFFFFIFLNSSVCSIMIGLNKSCCSFELDISLRSVSVCLNFTVGNTKVNLC